MQEALKSLIRIPAAITVFGVQRVQTTVGSTGTKEPVEKLCEVIDGMAAAVSEKIDESKPALDLISNLGYEVVERTWENTTGMVKTTADWLYGVVKAATPVSSGPEGR